MSANLLYVTSIAARAEALKAICVVENYALTIRQQDSVGDCSLYDLIFCDAETQLAFSAVEFAGAPKTVPIVAIYGAVNSDEMNIALSSKAIDVLSFPFGAVETASRMRCLSRLHMLQDELNHRRRMSAKNDKAVLPVLVIGDAASCENVKTALTASFAVECAADDMTGLLRAAQGQWSCVVLALSDESRDPASIIRQMRIMDRTRTMPVLVHSQADARCVAALQAGANDMAISSCTPAELIKRVLALTLRKSVLDALRTDAASIAPLTDFDHATGLPGPAQLMRSLPASLERLKAQGKPASLLLIAVDPLAGMPEGEAVPDSVMLALTQVLRRSLRGFDYACRYSADCFAILMPGANAAAAEAVAMRICAEIKSEKVRLKDARKDGTTASIGLATMAASGGAASAEQMIVTATDSLAKAQSAGAAQIVAQELRLAA